MKISLIFFLSLFSGFVLSQELELLESSGEMPHFLLDVQASNFFIPEPTESVRGDYKYGKKEHYLYEIYRSGMIVYGDSISSYCTQLLDKLGHKNQVYGVKSKLPGVFSNPQGDLFITTGLFSQLTSEAELAFFLTREILALENKIPQKYSAKNKEEKTLEIVIRKLVSYTAKREQQIDSLAFSHLLKTAPYNKNELLTSLDVLLYAGVPFYEININWDYFNTDLVYVPENELLFLYKKKNFDYYNPYKSRPDLVERKKKISRDFSIPESENFKETYLLNQALFDLTSGISHRDDILNDIIHTHFLEALYEIYILESRGKGGFYMDYLKAQAWLGALEQKQNLIRQNQYNDYEFSDNEGALFCRFIRSQNPVSMAALTIRMLHDMKRKYPAVKSFETLCDESLRLANKIPAFKLEDFRKISYREHLKKMGLEPQKPDPANTDNRKVQFETKKEDPFYLFVLSDLVSDPEFSAHYDSITSVTPESQVEQLAIKSFYLRSHTIESRAQNLLDPESLDAISALSHISLLEEKMKMDATAAYNRKSIFNATIIQSYSHNRYKRPIHPVLSEKLIDTGANKPESYCIGKYENQFKPKLRGIYFTGLFVIPLPYLIPEFFYSGHQSLFATFYFNAQTGQMDGVNYRQFKDPCTKIIFKNLFFQSLSSTYNKKP